MTTRGATTDAGWSWVVAGACCWVTFVIQGLVRCSGVVYVALIDAYGANRAQASWPFTLRMAVWNLSGPLAGALSYRWSIRTITFGGVLLVTATNVVCWLADDIYIVTFFLGGLQGLGVGMAVTLVPVIINQYFSRYKSTGAGIACAGATAGSFALPPLVEGAVEEFGLRGAFLAMAGVTLHGLLGAALLRPQQPHKPRQPKGDQNLNFLTSKSAEPSDKEEMKSLLKNGKHVFCQENGSKSTKTVRFSFTENKSPKNETENEETSLLENTVNARIVRTSTNEMSNGVRGNNATDTDSRTVMMNSNYTHILEPLSSKNDSAGLTEGDQNESHGKLHFQDVKDEYDPQINLAPVHLKCESNLVINSNYAQSPSSKKDSPGLAEGDQNEAFSSGRLHFKDVEGECAPQINTAPHLKGDSNLVARNSNYTQTRPSKNDSPGLTEGDQHESFSNGRLHFKDFEDEYDPQINIAPHLKCESNLVYCPTTETKQSSTWLDSVLVPVRAACQIVRNPMFLIIASNYSVFFLSYMTYLIVIVDHSLDLGVDRTDSVFLISTFSVADLIGRLGSGWITDSGMVRRKHLMMVNMVTVGGLLIATSFTTTYMAVTAVSVCTGLVVGINLILFYALLEEYLGLKQLPMAVGLMNFSIGVISFVTPLLTGYFRDTMGSYDHLFHFLGGVSIFCGLLWILEPVHAACNRKTVEFEKTQPC